MSEDARFEDGEDKALNIGAFDKSDLEIVSSLIQDSILPANEIKWLSTSNKLALLINRVRWEDKNLASSQDREVERVQSLLMISHVKVLRLVDFLQSKEIKFCPFYLPLLTEMMEDLVTFYLYFLETQVSELRLML